MSEYSSNNIQSNSVLAYTCSEKTLLAMSTFESISHHWAINKSSLGTSLVENTTAVTAQSVFPAIPCELWVRPPSLSSAYHQWPGIKKKQNKLLREYLLDLSRVLSSVVRGDGDKGTDHDALMLWPHFNGIFFRRYQYFLTWEKVLPWGIWPKMKTTISERDPFLRKYAWSSRFVFVLYPIV